MKSLDIDTNSFDIDIGAPKSSQKHELFCKISVLPKPFQKPYPPISQVVDGERSIQWAAENGIKTIMWIPTVKALKKRFEIYRDAKSRVENRDVPLGEG